MNPETELNHREPKLSIVVSALSIPLPGGGVGFTFGYRWPDGSKPYVYRLRMWPTAAEALQAGKKNLEVAIEDALRTMKGNQYGKTEG